MERQDSIRNIFAGTFSDTTINGMKLKKISEYRQESNDAGGFYYGKLEFIDGKLLGDQPKANISSNSCNPCYKYDYRTDGTLYSEGVMSGDCQFGTVIRYFPNGKNAYTTNYIPADKKASCNIRHGETMIYNRNGEKVISEFWNKGKFIKAVPYQTNVSGDVHFQIDNRILLMNDTVRLDELKKIKLQPDSSQNSELKNGYYLSIRIIQNKKMDYVHSAHDLKDFNNEEFLSNLKKRKINLNKPIQMIVDIKWKLRNEYIETHYLLLEK